MKIHTLFAILLLTMTTQAQESRRIYLSGTDKDHTRTWEFQCTKGARSGVWTTIEVPSCWELQGFGSYNYGHDIPHADEQGLYRYRFETPTRQHGEQVWLVFEGSMTDTEVWVNGTSAGERHQGAFYPFRYEVTHLLKKGENLLEVTVSKESANESINRAERQADYWIFGGIFRPVYLLVTPQQHIERVSIDARADGDFLMKVESTRETTQTQTDIIDLSTGNLLATLKGDTLVRGHLHGIKPWSTETPHRYQAVVRLMKAGKVLHVYRQNFGFRTVEFRAHDGFYLNGRRVMFKGVCRHTFWPESGRASSPALAVEDVNLIKDMNMNAVRMSHYPPDEYFLDTCDSLGLFVIDELAGWQKKYDTDVARRLVRTMVQRDVNHPSIVMWSNGNEGGFNTEVRGDYGKYDIQHRKVIEPFSRFDGTDTNHYPRYSRVEERLRSGEDVYFPTEFLHGLYDGGHGAGLDDYWFLMTHYPTAAGGFLWNLADEGVVRHDRGDILDCDTLHAPDGILGPHHEKEGSFYAIRDIWSPIQMAYDGHELTVSNRYMFTNLDQCRLECDIVRLNTSLAGGHERIQTYSLPIPDIAPGSSQTYRIELDQALRRIPGARPDVIRARVYDPSGRLVGTWDYVISKAAELADRIVGRASKEPMAASVPPTLPDVLASVRLTVPGTLQWTALDDGWWRLDYAYTLHGDYDYAGLTMDYEAQVDSATLVCDGPYRSWKNRRRGNLFGLYDKNYNNTVTGESWDYPEFKGYYSRFCAVCLHSTTGSLTIVSATDGMFLHLLTPQLPRFQCANVQPPFPDGDISVLNCIPPIGTKFCRAADLGPQGQKNHFEHETFSGSIYFRP